MDYIEKIKNTFNNFNGNNLDILNNFYDNKVLFVDPVKSISGLDDLKNYYKHIYSNVSHIHFEFTDFISMNNSVCAEWNMNLQAKALNKGQKFKVRGCSVFKFNDQGLVFQHHDYLDLGQMVYEKIPVLGSLIKTIKNKL